MRTSSVVVRLFIVTTLIFIIFVSIAFVIQIKSFEEYYFNRKIQDIDTLYDDFIAYYQDAKWNQTTLDQRIKEIENKKDVKIALVDNHYTIINDQKFKIYILSDEGQIYEVELNEVFTKEDYANLDIHTGDTIKVDGYFWGNTFRKISLIRLKINDEIIYDGLDASLEGKIILDHVSGTVMRTKLPDRDDLIFDTDYSSVNIAVDRYYFNPSNLDISNNSFVYKDVLSTHEYIVKVFPLNDRNTKAVFIMTNQQPIIEATEALKAFYPGLVTGVFIIGAIMMLFLTFSISNPLYDIERKAEKLVQFDFTDYLEIKHNDEIGSLSRSLNQLSYNLECSLKELSEANEKLKMDMAQNREIEHVRKEFIRNISHDFKTPLGVIKAFAEGLEDGVLVEEETSYYTSIILEEVATLEALVNDMLELSKLQTGAYSLEIEEFHINTLINNIIEKNQRLADKKEILLSFISTPYDMVYADYRKMSRAIQNFVSNAIQYSEEGQVILIQTEVLERNIRFEIHNICEQMSQDDLEKIWGKFYRIDQARTKSGNGSGLGLAIAKEILEQHRCDYGVANTSNGIVFYFEMDKYVNHIV